MLSPNASMCNENNKEDVVQHSKNNDEGRIAQPVVKELPSDIDARRNKESEEKSEVTTTKGEEPSGTTDQQQSDAEVDDKTKQESVADSDSDSYQKLTTHGKLARSRQDNKFPHRLMDVLEREVAPSAMWWISGGTAFAMEPKKMAKGVLKDEFGGIKYESFLRTLRRWGFKRMQGQGSRSNVAAYSHVHFQKGSPDLLSQMNRQTKEEMNSKDIDHAKKTVAPPHHAAHYLPNSSIHTIVPRPPLYPQPIAANDSGAAPVYGGTMPNYPHHPHHIPYYWHHHPYQHHHYPHWPRPDSAASAPPNTSSQAQPISYPGAAVHHQPPHQHNHGYHPQNHWNQHGEDRGAMTPHHHQSTQSWSQSNAAPNYYSRYNGDQRDRADRGHDETAQAPQSYNQHNIAPANTAYYSYPPPHPPAKAHHFQRDENSP